jgi:hypothetical protein
MARGFFGGRKGPHPVEQTADWPQLPGALQPTHAPSLDLPAVAYAMANTSDAPAPTQEAELLAKIVAFRSAVADSLFEISKDYQILCNLTHENLEACDQTIDELRRRLTGNVHYAVLAKLDEVHALVAEHIDRK